MKKFPLLSAVRVFSAQTQGVLCPVLVTKMGSPRKTGTYTEPIRCRGFRCGRVFYTEYVNGFSWKCPFCGTVH